MPTFRRHFILEQGQLVTIQDEAGNQVFFASVEDLNRCTGMDFTGKYYIGYEPDIEFFQDSEDETITNKLIPYQPYEELISNILVLQERKDDPTYGLSGQELIAAQKATQERTIRETFDIEANASVEVTIPEGTFTFVGGEGSAAAINGAVDLAEVLNEPTVLITDVTKQARELSHASARIVAANIAKSWRDAFFKKQAALFALTNE